MGMSRATTESKPRKIIMHADPKQPNDSGSVLAAARRPKKMLRWALAVILVFAVGIGGWARRVSLLTLLRTVTLFPVALAVGSAALLYSKRNTNNDPSSRAMVPLALVVAVVAAQLPPYLAVGLASACILAFSVGTLPTATNHPTIHNNDNKNDSNTNNDKSRQVMAVVGAVLLVVAVLLTENFLIWVVSATFVPGQSSRTAPPPLQDNGQRVLLHLLSQLTKPQVVSLRRLWNTQWALVACLGASLATVEYNNNRYRGRHHQRHSYRQRTLYGVATRMAVTVALARFIRTVSFGLTVIPSPVPNCYAQRFPVPPPVEWNEWIWVGLIPRSHGGCNDLIISGHATVTSSST